MTSISEINKLNLFIKQHSKQLLGFSLPIQSEQDYQLANSYLFNRENEQSPGDNLDLILFYINKWEVENYIKLPEMKGIQLLKYLMEQNNLRNHDLPEIGSSSYVSKVLRGENDLQIKHIQGLSKKFGLPKAAFLE
ncbi:hypothetical protein FWP33_17105 [Vibrio parahaemolyticus]|uniref:Transcriptional regulator n=2 Tax=Vibrio harveyi group TaxID=717610 RepID=A0A9Q3U9X1_VIBPH|nr:hypothetical protein [Vibrio parahaemolyticus]ELA8176791.1 hypothetical protein [Vibrio alginolyticus]CAH1593212.1 putative Antitoxin HigA [Vibrio jasicida]EGQ9744220.1 hypothetical protein [Vibrio parahaemolyticus]EJC7176224.1 hypothetical protein [Vibrio parahaemolyticus]EJE4724670.1 hypothetical protein [Vibrio parahaemolyticus]